ncbi:MAG TPA: isoprenylcysteine carboxylmethyltransferase family protein [Vicinamibacterales bacterium]|nr:isoprenylcysteine carboxylmethyltransferase family protein [Vicinamibacterales bacterium]
MTDDAVFRWVMVAGFAAVVGITAPHRVRAGTREKLDRRKEGVFMLATLRPAGGALWFSMIAYMINPAWMAWSATPLPVWLRWTGAGFCALCVALLLWTLPALGTNLTDTVVTREHHTLVTRGPYRWIRHPFYVAMALVTVGAALVAANWFILASGIVVFTLLAVRSRVEEEQLAARFGDAYREYQKRTGRFLPKLKR